MLGLLSTKNLSKKVSIPLVKQLQYGGKQFFSKMTIPIIDISAFQEQSNDSKSKDIIAKEVHQACTDVGFFYVKNHGISHEILDKALDLSSDFFKLPQGEKEKISISNITQNQKV